MTNITLKEISLYEAIIYRTLQKNTVANFRKFKFLFKESENHQVLKAIELVKKYIDSKIVYYPDEEEISEKIIPNNARGAILEETDNELE